MTERRVWEVAQVDAALDAALETGPLDFEEGDVTQSVDIDGEVGMDGDGDVDVDPDDSILEPEPASLENSEDNIRVFVRVRPPSAREGSAPCRDIVRVEAATNTVHLLAEPARVFTFDGVLGESASQEEVFKLVGTSVGEACLHGYNGSIYVYGQTGSGKTYTMQGPVASVQSMHSNDRRGIMCRILDLIFAEVGRRHREGGSVEYRCKCSYLEIYREQITDLLEPGSTNLQVREDINRGIYVERLSEHTVWTVSDAYHVLWKGLHQRHVSATHMNDLSSRSHAVFTLILEATSTTSGGVTSTRSGRLSLIDLAGSERQTFDPHNPTPGSLPESLRMKEAGAINRSLSALTNVIMSLSRASQRRRSSVGSASGNQRRPFVRYRDSKLTFLLRDSLGGNSKTVIVANCSPSALCFGETLSTLKFAARAKHIRCAAVMNEEYSGTVESLMLEVKSLKQQLSLLSSRGLISGEVGTESQASFLATSRSKLGLDEDVDDDPLEALIAAGNGDLRRLYGPRRVRRLEILLAAALERERRCELRRHKLDKFTQYLDGLLEQKEKYFDGLRDYFAYLVESASIESCYRPELLEKLCAFRQQLCRVPTDGRGLVDFYGSSAIAEDTDGVEPPQHELQQQASGLLQGRSPSYSLIGGDRSVRRSASQSMQKSPSGRLMRALNADSPSFIGSTSMLASPTSGAWFGNDLSPEEEHMECLRAENKLLRRQLESHPELHRLAVENRLLREHLASLVQQHAMAREEPPWPKGHRHARRANTGGDPKEAGAVNKTGATPKEAEGSGGLRREQSLTRTRSTLGRGESEGGHLLTKTGLGKVLKPGECDEALNKASSLSRGPFPGIEEATQISGSDSSGESEADDSDIADEIAPATTASSLGPSGLGAVAPPRPGGDLGSVPGTADASSFLPTMAREVEELLHVKGGLEDSLKQFIRVTRANAEADDPRGLGTVQRARSGSCVSLANTEVDPKIASEILRGTSEALRVAESMLAKGKGEPLLLSANGGQDGEGAEVSSKGLDERDVFLSLMRSLPNDTPTLSRHGFASSAPHLSAMLASGGRGSDRNIIVPTLRLSNSTGSAASRLNRTRSTKQLHCIAEQPAFAEAQEPEVAAAENHRNPMFSGEALKESGQKARQLCHHLELIQDAYRDMREQFKPLQEEYSRRLDDLSFLEAQCRRLDVHCRLLEERAPGGTASRSQMATISGVGGGGILSRFQRLQGSAPGISGGRVISSNGNRIRTLSDSADSEYSDTLTPNGSRELSGSMNNISANSPPSDLTVTGTSAAGNRPWAWGVGSRSTGQPQGNVATQRASSVASSRPGGAPEVPPRGLLYAASVSELGLDSQRNQGGAKSSSTWRPEDYIRRVMSAPQLPVVQTSVQHVPDRSPPESQVARSSSNPSGLAKGANTLSSAGIGVNASTGITSATLRAEEEPISPSTTWGGASSSNSSAAAHASFETKTFLSLAKQPGAKTAALQYLMSSTRNALGTIGESQEGRSPSKTPGTSPTRSASVGSLGGLTIGNVTGVGSEGVPQTVRKGSSSGTQAPSPSLVQPMPVSNSSLYGPASARAPFRGGQLAPSVGSSSALQGGVATGPVPVQSKSSPNQAQPQSRQLAPPQQAGISLRSSGSALPGGSLVATQRQNNLGHLNGGGHWSGQRSAQ